ncbi:MAG: glycogen debranching protein [Microbacterium sp.]|uniref:amylo-alpha-1,6-glucosidase n=1 Tax=Microbacterium sp. TaxID=51671 RepID=UPI001AC35A54|nr:glycogen debranching protein [Microbacterium sp.]MBN9155683.1 glycogen debranching protein [Microbacterium sp.]
MDTPLPSFDVREIPFSRRGAWIDLSPVVGLHHTAADVHLVSHRTGMHAVLALVPRLGGTNRGSRVTADPAVLTWTCEDGVVEAVFAGDEVIRLRGRGVGMRIEDAAGELTPFTGAYLYADPMDGTYVFTSYETGLRYRVTSLSGSIHAEGAGALGAHGRFVEAGGDEWELLIEEAEEGTEPARAEGSFDDAVDRVRAEFAAHLEAVAPWRSAGTPAAALAVYLLWSATVRPDGFLARASVLMSKNWMDKVWSWDHCFNALALAPGLPDEALDQFLAPFDHQDAGGALPDSIAHSEILRNFVKPPIHGWTFARLRRELGRELTRAELTEVYGRLAAWSRFWLDRRTPPGSDLPHYQHGNDSGWDNATVFDRDRVVESPDLAAFLVLQLDQLGVLAHELGIAEATFWYSERDRVQAALLSRLHDGDGFFAVGASSGERSSRTSLLTALPVLAAHRFPAEVRARLADKVAAHLTPWGLATQPPDTPEYDGDGYWRGPIWAPSTLLIEDGLRSAGFADIADTVSARFRALCERSGFAENFDALTGEGLRDRAYTWTASVYLILARDAVARGAAS